MTNFIFNATVTTTQNLARGDNAYVTGIGQILVPGSDGILAAGNTTLEVDGTVYSGGGDGVRFTSVAGNSAFAYVGRTGMVSSGPNLEGVNFTGPGTHTLVNDGQIRSIGFDGFGVQIDGAGTIVNRGAITAASGILDANLTAGDRNAVYNYGSISGTDFVLRGGADRMAFDNFGSASGGVAMGSGAGDLFYNTGSLALNDKGFREGAGAGDAISNYLGSIVETVNDTAAAVDMILFGSGAGDYLYNSGIVRELGATRAASNAIHAGAGNGDFVVNDTAGEIDGNVSLGAGSGQYVYNPGLIKGDVHLGNGAGQAYTGATGTLDGTLFLGAGGDYALEGVNATTVVAGLGNDTLDMSNGGHTTVRETAANLQVNGFDTLRNFQTAANGAYTRLSIDSAFAGTTLFAAFQGGTLVEIGLGGGNYSFVNVLGASVATVQSQTFFA